MAKPHRRMRNLEFVSFSIDDPGPSSSVPATSGGTIRVIMDDGGSPNAFAATIFLFTPGTGAGTIVGGPTPFGSQSPTTTKRTLAAVGVGTFGTSSGNNRIVQVADLTDGGVIGHPFKAVAGSGSSGSLQLKFCKPGQLVPVALTLKLDSKVTRWTCAKCTELNRPTLLLHSDEAKFAGCWYSRPIAFGGKGAPPGYWVLGRNSATAWTLFLKQGDTVVVTFTAKTKPKDCSLPIKLQRKGAGSKVCKDWPKTVSISPAS